eukprot:TRINITY_DN14768_c0_g1_i1.p1 TRINITY_DN14768_c0_g1~~TRINITY_DN14768_c0_g1_i1.p1  ORF type:complete len:236 (-),score=30.95 TRINITY_DN14768_c0_g1_i1:15-722(-)
MEKNLKGTQQASEFLRVKPTLNDVVKIELLAQHSREKISEIWKEYHRDKFCVSAVIPTDTYQRLLSLVEPCPLFVLPFPRVQRDKGEERTIVQFFYLQWTRNMCQMTLLSDYKVDGQFAQPALIMMHYTDLQTDKGIVLMRGEINKNKLNSHEAQMLANLFQLFYFDESRYDLVKRFNTDPKNFDFRMLLKFFQDSSKAEATNSTTSTNTPIVNNTTTTTPNSTNKDTTDTERNK